MRRTCPRVVGVLVLLGGFAMPGQAIAADTRDYVVLAESGAVARTATAELGIAPTRTYGHAFAGFAARLSGQQAATLRERAGVLGVEEDRVVRPVDPTFRLDLPGAVQPNPPNWGLDRIDQRGLPLDQGFHASATGAGVTIYVLDSGVDASHPQFEGRAQLVMNAVDDVDTDCDGHGTVVAGIAAARDFGVAKQAELRSVKVLDCNGAGSLSSLLAGMDYLATHLSGPTVAVMSWSYGDSPALAAAVGALVAKGVFVTASAGNSGGDACSAAPRSAPGVLVVANATADDQRAVTSSTGPCVDLYAPGTHIVSTVPGGGTASYTGTSMAAPHAAGVAALYKQVHGDAPSDQIEQWLKANATPDAVHGVVDSPNLLLNTGGL